MRINSATPARNRRYPIPHTPSSIAPPTFDDTHTPRRPPPGYPFPDPTVQAQQAMVNLHLPYSNPAGNEYEARTLHRLPVSTRQSHQ